MKRTLVAAAARAIVRTPQELPLDVYDREPDIRSAIEHLLDQQFTGIKVGESGLDVTTAPVTYDLLRAVWGFGYGTCESDGAAFLGAAGQAIAESRDLLGRAAAQLASSHYPTAPPFPDAWRPEMDALAVFLAVRDRKCDDGDALQAWADAGPVLTAQLGISSGLDRAIEALVVRRERQKRTGDVGGARATDSAIELVRTFQ